MAPVNGVLARRQAGNPEYLATMEPRIKAAIAFAPWGWNHPRVDWREHQVFIDEHRWDRNVQNRASYSHQYNAPARPLPQRVEPRRENHEVRPNIPERGYQRREAPKQERRDNRRDERR